MQGASIPLNIKEMYFLRVGWGYDIAKANAETFKLAFSKAQEKLQSP